MKQIESFSLALELMKEGSVLVTSVEGMPTYFGIRNNRIRVKNQMSGYYLSEEDFISLFHTKPFFEYEPNNEEEVSLEKDKEYYSWQHK